MSENTLASLIVSCSLKDAKILDLYIENCIDEISYLRIALEVPEENTQSDIDNLAGSGLSVCLSDGAPLFYGYCDKVMVNREGDYCSVEILVSSYVNKSNFATFNVTYQDPGKTLEQIARIAFQKYGAQIHSASLCRIPFVVSQNRETDWSFVKRLANQFGMSLFSNVREYGMHISIGAVGRHFSSDKLTRLLGLSKSVDELRSTQGNISEDASSYQFLVEKFECTELSAIAGDKIDNCVICKNQLFNDGGILKNHVYLKKESDVRPLSSNALRDIFTSMVLGGTVKSVEGNNIKVTLDNAAPGLGGGCVDVPYESAISNSFYCMPDVGDQVFIYYENTGGIVCLGSKRSNTNGEDFQTPEEKVLNNKDQMLRFTDTAVTITNTRKKYDEDDTTQVTIIMDDAEGITITSGNEVIVKSSQDGILTLSAGIDEENLQEMQALLEAGKDRYSRRFKKGDTKYKTDGGMSASELFWAARGEEWDRTWKQVGQSFVDVWDEITLKEVRDAFSHSSDQSDDSQVEYEEEQPYVDGVVTIYGLNSVTIQVGDSVIVIDCDVYFGSDIFGWLGYERNEHEAVVAEYQDWFDLALDAVQVVLDILGLFPVFGAIPDLINAGISLARGDVGGAVVSLFCAIPYVGDAAGVAKLGIKGAKAAAIAAKVIPKVSKVIKVTQMVYAGISLVNTVAGTYNIIYDILTDGKPFDWTNANDLKKIVAIVGNIVGIAGSAQDIYSGVNDLRGKSNSSNGSQNDGNPPTNAGDAPTSGGDGPTSGGDGPSNGGDGPSNGGDGAPTADGGSSPDSSARANDGGPTSADASTTAGDPINMATGSLTAEQVDLSFENILGTYALRRVYESVYDNRGGILGNKWRFEIESNVELQGEHAIVQMPDLHLERFEKVEGVWKNKRECDEKLVFSETDTGYTLKIRDKAVIYEYDKAGNLSSIIDIHGNRTRFIYSNGQLKKIELTSGLWAEFTYLGARLSSIEDSLGRKVIYEYEGDYLKSVRLPNGGTACFEYTPEGYLTKMTDFNGKWISKNYYDRKGRVIRQELAGGEEFVAFYDDKNKQNTFLTTSTGENVIYQYNENDLITQETYPDSTTVVKRYDAANHLVYFCDRMGRDSYAKYDAAGMKTYEKNPEGLETWFEYNELGLPTLIKSSAGTEWIQKYDDQGNLLEDIRKIGEKLWGKTVYTYDDKGRVLSKTDANGNCHSYQYDTLFSGPSRCERPDGAVVCYTYNDAGKVVQEKDAYGITSYGYNVLGHVTSRRDADGNLTKYEYDKMANLMKVILPNSSEKVGEEGASTNYGYDEWTHLTQMVTPEFGVWLYENDYLGNIKCVKNPRETYDANALGTRYEYDVNHHKTKTIYSDGSILLEQHDVLGNLVSRTLPEQVDKGENGYQYKYDVMNRLVEIKNPLGEIEKHYVYDLQGNMVKEISAKGYASASNDTERIGALYEYDLMGRLLKVRIPVEVKDKEICYQLKTYEYDAVGNRVCDKIFLDYQSKDSERGRVNVIHYRYDGMNRLLSVTDSTGSNMEYAYNERGQKIMEKRLISDGVWQETRYEYSAAGRLTCQTTSADQDGTGKAFVSTRYFYDKNGNVIKVQLPSGDEILREYDVMDRLVAETFKETKGSVNNRTEYKYDLCSNLTEITYGDGYKKTFAYDALNRRIQSEDSEGAIEKYGYDKNGDLTNRIQAVEQKLLGAKAKGWSVIYDVLGRELATYAPDGSVRHEVKYNQWGEKSYEGNADGGVQFAYDFAGRRILADSKEGRKQEYRYDAAGNIIGIRDGNGADTEYITDLWGRITQIHRADGGREKYAYDYAGNVISAVDGLNNEVTYRYNCMNLLASRKDSAGAEETFAYDGFGNMVSHRNRNDQTEAWQYNIYGAPTLHRAADGSIAESYQYDAMGRLSSAIGGGMRYEYRYLPGGNLHEKLASGKTLLRYAYDEDGRRIKRSDLSGKETEYKYDLAGNLTEVLENGRSLAKYDYHGTKPSRICFGNGKISTEFGYDADGNVINLKSFGDKVYVENAYQYNGNGDMTMRQGLNGNTSYCYDACRQLVKVEYPHGVESFSYDFAGNRVSRTYGDVTEQYRYDNCNRLTEMTRQDGAGQAIHHYDYDRQGNMISIETNYADTKGNLLKKEESRFGYDAFNRLESVSKDGKEIQKNHYDAEGLRYEMEENGKLVKFLYNDSREVVVEENAEGKLRRYVRGLGIICSDSEESKTYYHYVSDEQGSTTHILDDNGNVLNEYEYDAFGNLTKCSEQVTNRFLYHGEIYDAATGQYYLRARFYNPVIGRFTQEDTYYGAGLNLYAYCANNPVAYIDPTGHSPERMNDLYDAYKEYRRDNPNATASEAYEYARQKVDNAGTAGDSAHSDPRYSPDSYYKYKELKKLIKESGLSGKGEGLEAHHLLEKQYADKFGVSQGDIISVALTPEWHRGVNGEMVIGAGVNINARIEAELMSIVGVNDRATANSIATPENVWQAHRNVYESIGHSDWANAIYEAYVKPMGINY